MTPHTPHLVCQIAQILSAPEELPPEPPDAPARTSYEATDRQQGPEPTSSRMSCSPTPKPQLPFRQPAP